MVAAASVFLGVAFFGVAAFLAAAFFGPGFLPVLGFAAGLAGPLVTRPDLVLLRTFSSSTIAGAWPSFISDKMNP